MRWSALAFSLASIAIISQSAMAETTCRDALVKDTYKSSSGEYTNWKMASQITDKQWNEISREASVNVKIYGIPIGASYNDFQSNIKNYSENRSSELTEVQFDNIAWTFLSPDGAKAYQACIEAYLSQTGIRVVVSSATADEVALKIRYNSVGGQKTKIKPKWIWSGKSVGDLPKYIDAGVNIVVLKRPEKQLVFAVNYGGLGDDKSIGPINVSKPEGVRRIASPIVKNSGPLSSGACDDFSGWYSLCSDPQPSDWELVSHNFSIIGDRFCGHHANCEKTQDDKQRVCYRFQMQGHKEDCSWRNDNTGIYNSTGVLQTTWSHDVNSKPSVGSNIMSLK